MVGIRYPIKSLCEPMGANDDRSQPDLYCHDCQARAHSASLTGVAILNPKPPDRLSTHLRLDAITRLPTLPLPNTDPLRPMTDSTTTRVVSLESERNIDYRWLQTALETQDFQSADDLTRQLLCQLAGEAAIARKWVYFTEIEQFPVSDLQTIDRLWLAHSENKFGFSVQRQIWLGKGKNWDKLWSELGWKTDNNWTRYPHEFTWDLSAPKGHLPLSNQLRGVRVLAALFAHRVWG
jgi:GUN4-like